MADVLVATIPKNAKEEYRISRGDYNGHDLVHVRVWFKDRATGEHKPSAKGVSVRVGDKADQLADAIRQANAGRHAPPPMAEPLRSRKPYAGDDVPGLDPDDPIPF